MNAAFLTHFRKNLQISNFMKIRPVTAELFHVNGRTDGRNGSHDEANSRVRKFANATKNYWWPKRTKFTGD